MSKLGRSCVEGGANCVEVRAKLSRSSSEVVSKFERSCVEVGANCVEVRAKLCRSSSEVTLRSSLRSGNIIFVPTVVFS